MCHLSEGNDLAFLKCCISCFGSYVFACLRDGEGRTLREKLKVVENFQS